MTDVTAVRPQMTPTSVTVPAPVPSPSMDRREQVPWMRLAPGLAIAAMAVVVSVFGSTFSQYLYGLVIIYALSALGLDWLMGRAGQVSIGNGAIMAVGAYFTAVLSQHGLPFPVPLLLSGVAGAVVGLLIALPSLRLRGIYFALVTLALHFLVVFGARQYESHSGQISGVHVKRPTLGSLHFKYGPSYVILLSILLMITVYVLGNMYRRLPGRMWLAIRESELAASTIQVEVRRWKLMAFVGSSILIAMSGSMLAYYTGSVSADAFPLEFAITFVVMIIIGGMDSMAGAIAGAALVTLAPQALANLSKLAPHSVWLKQNLPAMENGLYGLVLMIVLLYLPRGLVPSVTAAGRAVTRRVRSRRNALRTPATLPVPAASAVPAVPARPASPAERPAADATAAVCIRGLEVVYSNGAHALNGIDLTVQPGDITAIVGRNGAGKSTLLRSMTGFFGTERVSRSGSVTILGREIIRETPVRTSRLGVVLVPERDKVFPSISVGDHLKHLGDVDAARELLPAVWQTLERRWKSSAGLLSGGERQLLALAMAASLRPKIMLIDEMTLGLAPVMINRVAETIAELHRRSDISIVIVEQNVAVAATLAGIVHHLENGEISSAPVTTPSPLVVAGATTEVGA